MQKYGSYYNTILIRESKNDKGDDMRNYICLLLTMSYTQTHTMLARVKPPRPARPVQMRHVPIRRYSEEPISHDQRVNNMVSAIKASSRSNCGRAHFINTLDLILAKQIERELKSSREYGPGFNYRSKHKLTDHQNVLVDATIKYLNEMQEGKTK